MSIDLRTCEGIQDFFKHHGDPHGILVSVDSMNRSSLLSPKQYSSDSFHSSSSSLPGLLNFCVLDFRFFICFANLR